MKRKHNDNKDLNERILEKAKLYVQSDTESEDDETDKAEKRKATKEDLEKKREKTRVNKLRKRQLKRGEIDVPTGPGKELAMQYLNLWLKYRDIWKFQKLRQNWLLKHMYDKKKISDSKFKILLLYLASMKGSVRERTLQDAEGRIKKYDDETNVDGKEAQVYARAREVVQMLV